jgi:N-dimethylarginine dimethylaminohydrolase
MKTFSKFLSEGSLYKDFPSEKNNKAIQTFLMSPPHNISNDVPNNIWIQELSKEEKTIDKEKAFMQWMDLYNCLSTDSLVYVLPAKAGLQDQTYVANLGICLPHTEKDDVVISNYTSAPRIKEADVGKKFFSMLDYEIIQAPTKFEGEADLKYLKDNIYIGGYGQRTQKETLTWFEKTFDMKVLPVHMTDEYLYHLDCMIFPLNTESIMACTKVMDRKDLKLLEKHVEIHDVDPDSAYSGITNSVRSGSIIFTHTNILDMKKNDENYETEMKKNFLIEKICEKSGLEPYFINISEFTKSGALMSCLVMHINYIDYDFLNV